MGLTLWNGVQLVEGIHTHRPPMPRASPTSRFSGHKEPKWGDNS